MFKEHEIVIHVKTGGEYIIVRTPREYQRLEYCNEPYYTYTNQHIDWVRPKSEMEDGRFVLKQKPDIKIQFDDGEY